MSFSAIDAYHGLYLSETSSVLSLLAKDCDKVAPCDFESSYHKDPQYLKDFNQTFQVY